MKNVYELYPQLENILPAVGYIENQMNELNKRINKVPYDLVLLGTPTDTRRYLRVDKLALRVRYELEELVPRELEETVFKKLSL